jgi:hypothetical protein
MLPPLRPSNVRPITSAPRSATRRAPEVPQYDNVRPIRPGVRAHGIELRARPMILEDDLD